MLLNTLVHIAARTNSSKQQETSGTLPTRYVMYIVTVVISLQPHTAKREHQKVIKKLIVGLQRQTDIQTNRVTSILSNHDNQLYRSPRACKVAHSRDC
jgi:hypothetical protein